ncbi:MAG: hypothetical protein J6X82_07555 [Bacteroidales bacterium]|nr:hypothetical protein [Bacteroidales bacterium]
MKKALLVLCAALSLAACTKDLEPSADILLEGEELDLKGFGGSFRKLFVLNEGGLGANNATLDFLNLQKGRYVRSSFRKMNPSVAGGLGDVGNDIALLGDELWMVINNSGIVEVASAVDETEIAAIAVPTPRNIAFDDNYAYVTSWAGAYATGTYDDKGNYTISDSSNPKGCVYRIGLKTKKIEGTVEVGLQPEGIACYGGRLYVANSGGISSQLPPLYSYDNTLSIIDAASFKLVQIIEVAPNLKSVWSDGKGAIYVTSMGNFWDAHTGLYVLFAGNPSQVTLVGSGSAIKPESLHVSCSCCADGAVYCIGTEDEFNWSAVHNYYLWSCKTEDYSSGKLSITLYPQTLTGVPYGMSAVKSSSDASSHYLVLGDAGDYFNPGTVSCYALDFNGGEKYWSVNAGVCPGHFAIW